MVSILKDLLEEDSPIVAPSHILFYIFWFFFFYIHLFWKCHVFSLNGWKVWILKDPIEGPPILVPQKIFLFLILTYPENLMCPAWTIKKFEFWHPGLRGPHCGTPKFYLFFIFQKFHQSSVNGSSWISAFLFAKDLFILVPPIFVKFYHFLVLAFPESFVRIARMVKKLEFWEGQFHCGIPKFCHILSFNLYLSILKISSVLTRVVEKFEFWHPRFREISLSWYPQILSKIILLWLKCLEFWRPRLGGPPILKPPNLVKFFFFFRFSCLKISCLQLKILKSLNF